MRNVKEQVNDWLFKEVGGVVQSGPFEGMKILPDKGWESNSLAPMLLGCFEEELHPYIEQEIVRLSDKLVPNIVNVGCSEGYYAIGMALRLRDSVVWAVDISDTSLKIAAEAAKVNGVFSQLRFGGPLGEVFADPDLVIMDCEGAEVEYLDKEKFPALRRASILVEIHNWPDKPRTDELLYQRFKDSHEVVEITESGRNPNRFKVLIQQTSVVRWASVCEYRPCLMSWFAMRPK